MSQQLQSYAPTSHEAQSPVPPAPTADHHQILLLSRSVESIKGSRTFTAGDNEEKGPSNVFSRSSSRQNMSDDAGSQHQSSRRASATSPSGGDATNKPYFQASSNRDSFNSEDSRSDQQYSNKSASLRSRQSSQSLLMQQQQQPSLVKPEAVRRSLSFMKSAESIQQSITDSRTSKTNTSNSPESSVGQQVPGSVSLPRIVNDHPTRPSDQSTGSIARSASRNSISGGGSADQQGTLSGDLPPRAITPSTPRRLDPISNTHHPINKTNSLVSQSTGTRSSSSELSYSGTESRSSYSGGTRSRTQSSASSSVL